MHYWTHEQDQAMEEDGSMLRPTCPRPACKGHTLVPMRFVAVCDNGHLDEVDWYGWAHRDAEMTQTGSCDRRKARLRFEITGKGGGDFESMKITCECGAAKSLAGINEGPLPQRCRGNQPGERPDGCRDPNDGERPMRMWLEPRGSSALHHPSVISALDIASGAEASDAEVALKDDRAFMMAVKFAQRSTARGLGMLEVVADLADEIAQCAEETEIPLAVVHEVFEKLVLGGDDEEASSGPADLNQRAILQEEFPVLASPHGAEGATLVCKPRSAPKRFGMDALFEKVVQVERLREVRVFVGFQRRDVSDKHPLIPPSLGRQRDLWYPAIEVMGEGIFLEFKSKALQSWLDNNQVQIQRSTQSQLVNAERLGIPDRMGLNANPVFLLVHSFAHALMNQLAFDCGYSSASLRERIYCGPLSSPYAGVLIYTADSDSEGSMGGLVEMGDPDLIAEAAYRCVAKAQWCSADPVCRELTSQGPGGLNRAACHACSLVSETSCVYANVLLNRALMCGDGELDARGVKEPVGYFRSVLDAAP